MKQSIITINRISDTIQLEGKYNFSAFITIGLRDSNNFYVELEFTKLNQDQIKILGDLYKLEKCLQFSSKVIDAQNYNITHIVVTNISGNNTPEITWKCISDDPKKSHSLIIE